MKDYFAGIWVETELILPVYYLGENFPIGTEVIVRPYPADTDYLEIGLPNGIYVTDLYEKVYEYSRIKRVLG